MTDNRGIKVLRRFLRLVLSLFAWAFLAQPLFAAPADVILAKIEAHPALWTVHGPKGTAYLLGSIHIMPPNMDWHTPAVTAALKASDVFVFEIPMDDSTKQAMAAFILQNAYLQKGITLPSLLQGSALKDYNDALARTHVPPALLADKRPWFAALMLDVGYMQQQRLSPESGVDRQVYGEAVAMGGKSFRAFETPEQQFALLMPEDRKLEVAEFDESLKEILKDQGEVSNMIDAWADGDVKRLGHIMNDDLKADPKMEKALLYDRNANWVKQIAAMLEENHTYFITVGAGHLTGPKGVPALLRAKGYKVEGP